ncbi:MAG: DUF3078 domain-containing protein [Chitinophagaceae bacterium]|nr:DUF3078 domain-containing protein [Chitinophagaceae bacterium]MDP1765042.1 DUF3078 domain-containing protein [Sediminibacterium sp.]MDP1810249.1 DUF3078 domain-containing protein [Sediminibacterium sp.]MDP3128740.1 DUF3078 domain-containing protein [Sediminibacterium sp.]MDP3666824.1 DUF3078 domain-containing protein [Sediminibacterium sp.]
MRKIVVLFMALFCVHAGITQGILVNKLRNETSRTIKKEADTSRWNWKRGGLMSFNLAQGSLSNWASGGDNFSLTVNGYFNYFFFFRKDRHSWDNNVDINLGFVQSTSLGSRKNDDRFDYLSKYGYKMDTLGKWYLSTLFNFRSQFFDGYTFSKNVGDFSSSFLSPAYFILSVGFDYKPTGNLSLFISPLTSRSTVISNKKLSDKGVYGVPAGSHSLNEIGAFVTLNYSNSIAKNILYKGRIDLFSNYQNHPKNVDIFMTNLFSFKINRFFSATYSLDMIYDDDIRLFGPNNTSPGMQTKSLIGIGFLKPLNVRKVKYN